MMALACGQKSGKIYLENPREYFRIVSVVSALFSQFRIRREGRVGLIDKTGYSSLHTQEGTIEGGSGGCSPKPEAAC